MNINLAGKRTSQTATAANTQIGEVTLLNQVHGNTIVSSNECTDGLSMHVGDAWQIVSSGTFGVKLADCLGLVLWSECQRFPVYVVHSGWRGSLARITEKALQQLLTEQPDRSNIKAFLSPAARSCCYEVGEEFVAMFGETYVSYRNEGFFFDNVKCNLDMLLEAGVLQENIETHPDCTICNNNWYSFRRDKTIDRNILSVTV